MMELNRADEMIIKGQVKMKYLVGKVRIENRILILNSRILFQSVLVFGVAVIAKAQLFCLSKTQQSFEKKNQYLLFSLFFFLMFITEPDTATSDYPAGKVLLETYMRYGQISDQRLEVVQSEEGWRPSTQNESDFMERHKQTPQARVRFISDGNADVTCVVKDVTPVWSRFWNYLRPYLYCIFFICGFWGISRRIRALWPRVCFFYG